MALFKIGLGAVKHLAKPLPSAALRGALACRTSVSYKYQKPFEPTHKAEFEVSRDPDEWKYVERVLPPKCVPTPQLKETYSSDWRPPRDDSVLHPYFVNRNRNHMIPVYLTIRKRGTQRITTIKRIKGDIWQMEQELRTYLKEKSGKEVGVRVDELAGKIRLRGDYVYYLTEWCKEKGF